MGPVSNRPVVDRRLCAGPTTDPVYYWPVGNRPHVGRLETGPTTRFQPASSRTSRLCAGPTTAQVYYWLVGNRPHVGRLETGPTTRFNRPVVGQVGWKPAQLPRSIWPVGNRPHVGRLETGPTKRFQPASSRTSRLPAGPTTGQVYYWPVGNRPHGCYFFAASLSRSGNISSAEPRAQDAFRVDDEHGRRRR